MRATNLLAILGIALALPAFAMEVSIVGDQAILTGNVDGTELAKLRDIAAARPSRVTTLVLRDLAGTTDTWTLMAAADYIADRGWRTVASGSCGSACVYLFLGGVQRQFSEDKTVGFTRLILAGTSLSKDSADEAGPIRHKGDESDRGNAKVKHWIRNRTGNAIDDSLLDRILGTGPSRNLRYLYFFDPNRLHRKDGESVFGCTGKENHKTYWDECEKILSTNIYRSALVTSPELVRSNDRPADSPATPGGPAVAPAPTPPGPAK